MLVENQIGRAPIWPHAEGIEEKPEGIGGYVFILKSMPAL